MYQKTRKSIHSLASCGLAPELSTFVQTYSLEIKHLVNSFNEQGYSPLFLAIAAYSKKLSHYSAVLSLLEAGANPLQAQNNLRNTLPPLFFALKINYLGLARLMLWHISSADYTNVKISFYKGSVLTTRSLQEFTEHDLSADDPYTPDLIGCIKETVKDIQAVEELKIRIENLLKQKNYRDAALCHEEIARIYEKHYKLEFTLPYPTDKRAFDDKKEAAPPEKYRSLLANYYQKQQAEHERCARQYHHLTDVSSQTVHIEEFNLSGGTGEGTHRTLSRSGSEETLLPPPHATSHVFSRGFLRRRAPASFEKTL